MGQVAPAAHPHVPRPRTPNRRHPPPPHPRKTPRSDGSELTVTLGLTDDRTANSGNFGFGQLVLGEADAPTRVSVIDLFDNGQRQVNAEAMYLFGIDGEGLRILGGSVLYLGGIETRINLYAAVDGTMVHINELLQSPNSMLAFDDGFISNAFLGDIDQDGVVDAADLDILNATIRSGEFDDLADIDGSGAVDGDDLSGILGGVLVTRMGDVDLDGNVGIGDLNYVRNNFGQSGGWALGDLDGSGVVDLADLNAVRNNFGFDRVTNNQVVPEPSTGLLGLVLVLLIAAGYRAQVSRSK